jgi:DNA-binding Lrp family transcriptional regulator
MARPRTMELQIFDLVEAHGPISMGWITHMLGFSEESVRRTVEQFITNGLMSRTVLREGGKRMRMISMVPVDQWVCSLPRRVIHVPASEWRAEPIKAATSVFELAEVL